MENDSRDSFIKQIAVLTKKLERCEQSRMLIEQAKDHYDLVNQSLIERLAKQKDLLDKKNRDLDAAQLELMIKNRELEEVSITDGLTQINNRRRINDILSEEFLRANRYGIRFSVILIDIDFFKTINDNFGHQTGDKVLYDLAQLIKNSLRVAEHVGRWGGEEFLIVLPNTNAAEAYILSERIRSKISCTVFLDCRQVTSSFGITENLDNDSMELIVKRVDIALYQAKVKRNCSCIYIQ